MKLVRITDDKFHAALNKLATKPLPLRTAFKLKGISKVVREEYLKYEDVRKEALQKHALKNEDGSIKVDDRQNAQFDEAGIKDFVREINELNSVEISVPTVKVSELGNIDITLTDVELLDGIIVED